MHTNETNNNRRDGRTERERAGQTGVEAAGRDPHRNSHLWGEHRKHVTTTVQSHAPDYSVTTFPLPSPPFSVLLLLLLFLLP